MAEEEGIILCLACRCACKASTTDQEDPMLHLCQMFSKIKTALDAYQSHKLTSSVSFCMDAPQCEKYWFAVNLVQSNYSKTETDVRDDQQCLDSFFIFRDTCFMLQEQMF